MLCIKNYDCKIPKLMRSPTTVFTKCLKIKLEVNMESQRTFLAVVWAEWELWRLVVLLHTVWESLESPAHHLIPVHQADVAQNHDFPMKEPEQKDQGQACSECAGAAVENWLKHPSPWVCPGVSGGGSKGDHSLCSQKGIELCYQGWGWPSLSQPCHCHITPWPKEPSPCLLLLVMEYPGLFHPFLSHRPAATQPADHSFLSLVFSPWISIIQMLKIRTEFSFISVPTKILFNCCISAVLCSLPKDGNHWVGDTILQCH